MHSRILLRSRRQAALEGRSGDALAALHRARAAEDAEQQSGVEFREVHGRRASNSRQPRRRAPGRRRGRPTNSRTAAAAGPHLQACLPAARPPLMRRCVETPAPRTPAAWRAVRGPPQRRAPPGREGAGRQQGWSGRHSGGGRSSRAATALGSCCRPPQQRSNARDTQPQPCLPPSMA